MDIDGELVYSFALNIGWDGNGGVVACLLAWLAG